MPRTASTSPYRFDRSTTRIATSAVACVRPGRRAGRRRCGDHRCRPAASAAADQDLAVGRHAGLREADGALELQLDADDLLDAIVAEVGVLRRERRLRIDARDRRVDRLVRTRVDVDARRLSDLDRADAGPPARTRAGTRCPRSTSVTIAVPGPTTSPGSADARDDRAVERRADRQVGTVRLRLGQLRTRLLGLCRGARRPRLPAARAACGRWRSRPRESPGFVRLAFAVVSAPCAASTRRCGRDDRRRLLFGGRDGDLGLPLGHGAGLRRASRRRPCRRAPADTTPAAARAALRRRRGPLRPGARGRPHRPSTARCAAGPVAAAAAARRPGRARRGARASACVSAARA